MKTGSGYPSRPGEDSGVALATEDGLGVGMKDEVTFDIVENPGKANLSGPEQKYSKKLGPSVTLLQSRNDTTAAGVS